MGMFNKYVKVPLVLNEVKEQAPQYGAGFEKALNDNPNFHSYVGNLTGGQINELRSTLSSYTSTEDVDAFNTILSDIAKTPDYDMNQLSAGNVGTTVTAMKSSLATVSNTGATRTATTEPTPAPYTPPPTPTSPLSPASASAATPAPSSTTSTASTTTPSLSTPAAATVDPATQEELGKLMGGIITKISNKELPDLKDMSKAAKIFKENPELLKDFSEGLTKTDIKIESDDLVDMLGSFSDKMPAAQKADAKGFAKILEDDPELADAMTNAMTKDPTVLLGMGTLLMSAGEKGAFQLSDANKLFNAPMGIGRLARRDFTKVLNRVAESDEPGDDFGAILTFAQNAKTKYQFSFPKFLDQLKNNPDELIRDMFKGTGLEGTQMGNFLAGALKGMAPFLAAFIDPDGPILGPYVAFGRKYFGIGVAAGRDILNDPQTVDEPSTVTLMDKEDFIAKYKELTKDIDITKPLNDADIEQALKAVEEIDPKAKTEVKLALQEAKNDPEFRAQIEEVIKGGPESVGTWFEHLAISQSVADATKDTVNGKTATDVRKEQKVAQDKIEATVEAPADVAALNDETFLKNIEKRLGEKGPKNVKELFKDVKRAIPEDAKDEWDALENTNKWGVQNVFEKIVELKDPKEISKAINKIQNGMENGQTPEQAVRALIPADKKGELNLTADSGTSVTPASTASTSVPAASTSFTAVASTTSPPLANNVKFEMPVNLDEAIRGGALKPVNSFQIAGGSNIGVVGGNPTFQKNVPIGDGSPIQVDPISQKFGEKTKSGFGILGTKNAKDTWGAIKDGESLDEVSKNPGVGVVVPSGP